MEEGRLRQAYHESLIRSRSARGKSQHGSVHLHGGAPTSIFADERTVRRETRLAPSVKYITQRRFYYIHQSKHMSCYPELLREDLAEVHSRLSHISLLSHVDVDLDDVPDKIVRAYNRGDRMEARALLSEHLRQILTQKEQEIDRRHRVVNAKLKQAQAQVENVFSQAPQVPTSGAEVVGANVSALRIFLGLTRTSFTEMVGAFSRPTLNKIEQGGGAQLEMVDAIADAFNINRHLLTLNAETLEIQHEVLQHVPEADRLLGEVHAGTPASSYARELAKQQDASPEDLRVVSDIPESVDDRYDTRGARAGAVIGWTQEFRPSPAETKNNRITRRFLAAAVGAYWGHQFGPETDDGFTTFIDG